MMDFNKLKVTELRAELKARSLPTTGLKPVLVARLQDAEKDDGSESENTVQNDLTKLDTASAASPDIISPVLPSPEVNTAPEVPLATTTESAEPIQADPPKTVEKPSIQETPTVAETKDLPVIDAPAIEPQNDQSALPSVEPQEIVEDRQKRKRRSESPTLSAGDVARKRFRPSIDAEENGTDNKIEISKEDAQWVDKHNAIGTEEMDLSGNLPIQAVDVAAQIPEVADNEMGDVKVETAQETLQEEPVPATKIEDGPNGDSSSARDPRFQGLFQHDPNVDATMADSHGLGEESERSIAPAMHPATSALYIKDIMRPLNPANLRWHITSMAAAPGSEPDSEVVLRFHIDQIRTHAFVVFTNVSAASRVRSALHDRIWPDEKSRKPLWVDFIPEDKVEDWIQLELGATTAARTIGRKWEVFYDMDQDRNVSVALRDATNLPRQNPIQQKQAYSAPLPVNVERRFSQDQPIPSRQIGRSAGPPVRAIPNSAGRLNELFSHTTAKPVLYFKPVPREIVDKRLDALDAAISSKVTRGEVLDGPVHRYTLEDDKLVDRGPEIFPGLRPPRGFRGPAFSDGQGRNRGGRVDRGYDRGSRGGYGRGGYGGDVYRSSGSGYRDSRPDRGAYGGGRDWFRGGDRRYDSYRGNDRRGSGGFDRR